MCCSPERLLRAGSTTGVPARRRPIPLKHARLSEVCTLRPVTYVIVGSCIKDDSCIEVCPVDCIHPKPGAPDFETAEQLYIDPGVCIDCDACVEACPVDAIFPDFEVPEKYDYALGLNAEFFADLGTAERTAA
jgi:ferredoxin